ncbi:MAG: hypothetical protein SWH61_05420 [Thermodesulfobacteriota bacterium]|nr:hypothetical protein [Thermodesulfobacteriota bacterium]
MKLEIFKWIILFSTVIGPALFGLYAGLKPSRQINDVVLFAGVALVITCVFALSYFVGTGGRMIFKYLAG